MNQGGGIDRGGGGGEAELAGVTTTRVRVCLSRRGCRWADDISSGDRQQASARDASVWVSETEISFLFSSSGMALPSLSSLARFSVQQRVDVWRQVLAWTSESFATPYFLGDVPAVETSRHMLFSQGAAVALSNNREARGGCASGLLP